ncbi:MAG: glutamine-hydrolyzing GMP synthase [Magnetococcales bacterium]|nr:glutamine-hydrolyzing GMP synthase [Magnetococcales bacterium]NGZ28103.1 glutamine-hydrolyzing GMP synthase [Magnetococcales bacterium]
MSQDLHAEKILILDFGSQYTQLIARRVRECQVYCEIHPWDMSLAAIQAFAPKGIILSGGHQSVYDHEAPAVDPGILAMEVPILGICYGMQWLSHHLDGGVAPSQTREYGPARIHQDQVTSSFFQGFFLAGHADVWMSHGDHVDRLPSGFQVAARSENGLVAAMVHESRHLYGVQFHPEVSHTPRGELLIQNFARHICGCSGSWTSANVVVHAVERIRQMTGEDEVILGLSGGVDSSVVAALIHQAIGPRLTCVFVDNGLLRLNEGDQVMATFAQHMGVKVIRVDASQRFLGKLAGVSDPEQKRRIIGHTFIEVFEEEASRLPNARWLAQGTIYPDVIESAGSRTKVAANIKSHHNVGGLPERMGLKLLEPLRELFKDEVRLVGLEVGLPRSMIFRHPFPGPGLGVRILGEVSREKADILRLADAIFIEELYKAELYDHIGQAFAVFLPVKSVGVMGDGRTYDYVIALRAVETRDFMTASCYPLPHALLGRVANRIVNEVKGVNRVVFDVTSKPPGTIEWE